MMKIISHLVAAALVLGACDWPGDVVEAQDYTYTTNNDAITIVKYTGSGGTVDIPVSINGYPVSSIGSNTFASCTNLTSVTIGDNVSYIEGDAFDGCGSLAGVFFTGNAPTGAGIDRVFSQATNATVYYLPGASGWGPVFGGRPTALWRPRAAIGGPGPGAQTNRFGFHVSWARGRVVVVEASASLANAVWVPVSTNTLTENLWYFNDYQRTNYPGRFYRVRSGSGGSALYDASTLTNFPTYLDAKADFGAAGDGRTDDTAKLQAAINFCASNAPYRLYLPKGAYTITSALNLPHTIQGFEIFGAGSTPFNPDDSATRIVQKSQTDADGLHFLTEWTYALRKLYLHDFGVVGITNWGYNVTNCGIRLEHLYEAGSLDYGPIQMVRFERMLVSGFANGYKVCDSAGVRFEQCASMFNTNAAYWLQSAEETTLDGCWGGWGLQQMGRASEDRLTCIINDRTPIPGGGGRAGAGLQIIGGEWGNCDRLFYGDCTVTTWVGGNYESFVGNSGSVVLLTNNCQFEQINPYFLSCSGTSSIPIYRLTAGQPNTRAAGVRIVNGTLAGFGGSPIVSVEGSFVPGEMPVVSFGSASFAHYDPMVYHSSVGGPVTTVYHGGSDADVNSVQWWTQPQTFTSLGGLIVQNGYQYGSLRVGGDEGAGTLTANTIKSAMLVAPDYAAADYGYGFLHARSYNGANVLYIGGDQYMQMHAAQFVGFMTAATQGETGTPRWYIDPNGMWLAGSDNGYDIGASHSGRPRNLYVAGGVTAGKAITENVAYRTNSAQAATVDMDLRYAKLLCTSDPTIATLINVAPDLVKSSVLLVEPNGADRILTLGLAEVKTSDGARSWVVTNGVTGMLTITTYGNQATVSVYQPFF
ncbi:MAG TPA: glycosyl hydrolase family 28-related protein [Verrucomicrobiae bacterium]